MEWAATSTVIMRGWRSRYSTLTSWAAFLAMSRFFATIPPMVCPCDVTCKTVKLIADLVRNWTWLAVPLKMQRSPHPQWPCHSYFSVRPRTKRIRGLHPISMPLKGLHQEFQHELFRSGRKLRRPHRQFSGCHRNSAPLQLHACTRKHEQLACLPNPQNLYFLPEKNKCKRDVTWSPWKAYISALVKLPYQWKDLWASECTLVTIIFCFFNRAPDVDQEFHHKANENLCELKN